MQEASRHVPEQPGVHSLPRPATKGHMVRPSPTEDESEGIGGSRRRSESAQLERGAPLPLDAASPLPDQGACPAAPAKAEPEASPPLVGGRAPVDQGAAANAAKAEPPLAGGAGEREPGPGSAEPCVLGARPPADQGAWASAAKAELPLAGGAVEGPEGARENGLSGSDSCRLPAKGEAALAGAAAPGARGPAGAPCPPPPPPAAGAAALPPLCGRAPEGIREGACHGSAASQLLSVGTPFAAACPAEPPDR